MPYVSCHALSISFAVTGCRFFLRCTARPSVASEVAESIPHLQVDGHHEVTPASRNVYRYLPGISNQLLDVVNQPQRRLDDAAVVYLRDGAAPAGQLRVDRKKPVVHQSGDERLDTVARHEHFAFPTRYEIRVGDYRTPHT